ncbi:hypothetical protein [Streptomyces viridosporus]|uniref:DUF4439 domain-containing protein n=1 Tax=Streptomyces viridosporus T7A TaxID=665577 RepID=A0ABX6ALH1_STRVD|nr:hypothetical protein [Streptomyces viridosporus]QEU88021.1 hypothetical protein CP969_27510 [Streptomyces viridosporus T7A]
MEENVNGARRPGAKSLIVILCVIGLVAGLGTWLYIDSRGEQDSCQELLQHERIPATLELAYESDLSCAELGAAIKRATTGPQTEQHSLDQAQAMKNVLVAIDNVIGEGPAPLDQQLTGPVSMALADYAEDMHAMLTPGNTEYARRALPSEKAWTDSEGVHMSIPLKSLVRIMTSLSVDPEAYATLRDAMTQQAAQEFAAAPRSKSKEALSPYPPITAWTLGTMDAVANAAREKAGKENSKDWEEKTFTRLSSKKAGQVPSFDEDPAGHIVATWRKSLPSDPPDDLIEVLEAQSTELVRVWSTALGTSSKVQASLVNDARGAAWSAQDSTLRDLRG